MLGYHNFKATPTKNIFLGIQRMLSPQGRAQGGAATWKRAASAAFTGALQKQPLLSSSEAQEMYPSLTSQPILPRSLAAHPAAQPPCRSAANQSVPRLLLVRVGPLGSQTRAPILQASHVYFSLKPEVQSRSSWEQGRNYLDLCCVNNLASVLRFNENSALLMCQQLPCAASSKCCVYISN